MNLSAHLVRGRSAYRIQNGLARLVWLIRRLPRSVVLLVAALVMIGWLGISRSEEFAGGREGLVTHQIAWSVLSAVAAIVVCLPNYRVLCRASYMAFAVVLVLLVAVYFFPAINGARRWIRLGPIGVQPSELAKVVFVVALARYLMYRENFRRPLGLLAPLAIAMVPVILILREPDLGTATVFLPVLLVMLFAAGARRRDLALVVAAGLVALPLLWSQMSREQRSRVTALVDQTMPGERPTSDTFHLYQAKQVLALGGVWGSWRSGNMVDDASAYRVPEPATDSVFVVLGERYGLVGLAVILALYVALVWRGLLIAERTREPFGRLVAVGIAALLAVEVVVNTGMMVGLLPVTGLSLPLVSYGGSGLLAHMLAIGLLLNIGMRPGYEMTNEPFRYSRESRGQRPEYVRR